MTTDRAFGPGCSRAACTYQPRAVSWAPLSDLMARRRYVKIMFACVGGHSSYLDVDLPPDPAEREIVPERKRVPVIRTPGCELTGCHKLPKPGRRFCSRKHAGMATSPRIAWPAPRREAFIADYEAGVPIGVMAKRYGFSSWRRVAERAGQFRRNGYPVKYRARVA